MAVTVSDDADDLIAVTTMVTMSVMIRITKVIVTITVTIAVALMSILGTFLQGLQA